MFAKKITPEKLAIKFVSICMIFLLSNLNIRRSFTPHLSTFPAGGNWSTRVISVLTFGTALTSFFQTFEPKIKAMSLEGGSWNNCATEAPQIRNSQYWLNVLLFVKAACLQVHKKRLS